MRMRRNSTVNTVKLYTQRKNTYTNQQVSQKKLSRIKGFGLLHNCGITEGCQSNIAMKNKRMKIQEIFFPQRQRNKQIKVTEYYVLFETQKGVGPKCWFWQLTALCEPLDFLTLISTYRRITHTKWEAMQLLLSSTRTWSMEWNKRPFLNCSGFLIRLLEKRCTTL